MLKQLQEQKVCRIRSHFPKQPCKLLQPHGIRKESQYHVDFTQTARQYEKQIFLIILSLPENKVLKNFSEKRLLSGYLALYLLMKMS